MSEFSEKMGVETGNLFKSGYNCGEAVVQAFRTKAGVNIDDNAFRLVSGFGGGMGHARDLCGALAGCTMVISTLVGRNNPAEKPLKEIYPYSKEWHDRFVKEFGSSSCKDLLPFEFDTREHYINCMKLVNKIGKSLAEYLVEKELIKEK
jgi:C_GCAxxG_C_C family probable redox protein